MAEPAETTVTEPVRGHLVGEPCPAFALVDTFGERLGPEDLLGGPSLIVFYPFAFTPICDEELTEMEGRIREFDNVGVLAISCDPPAAIRAWQEHKDFSFAMASDFWPHGAAARAFGVFDEASGHPRRASFAINADGRIVWSVINPSGVPRPVQGYLDALAPHRGPGGMGNFG